MASTTVSSAIPTSTHRAPPQGGIIDGKNPADYDPKNPIILFIIQAILIIGFSRLLHIPLRYLRQPRVISEVLGGIILGPSCLSRVRGFSDSIFPAASLPNLTLVANIGLVLFLFIVGLEVDVRIVKSNLRVALSVGLAGMILPFGLGCAIAWGLYNEFHHGEGLAPISFAVYMLFVGIAMAITAFPVLCRILTELKLLNTPVGIIVLSAGVGNDVVGWILLALCVALVNSGTGLTALWVLLICVGYTLALIYGLRPVLYWFLKNYTRSLVNGQGPSQTVIALTLMIALVSAFFTGIIGVHPIFGAFLAGIIMPHEAGFAIKVTEKVEDMVSAIFLPLYFALSGLSTNLGLLDNGVTWGYVFGVISVAFFGKVLGGSGAARLNGLVWRECFTIGSLMSCKGLVELIVLNIGLQAKILSERTFTIFVVMALVTTCATTPLVSLLYPPSYQRKIEAWKRGELDWATGLPYPRDGRRDSTVAAKAQGSDRVGSVLVYLRLDGMPALMTLMSLFSPQPAGSKPAADNSSSIAATDSAAAATSSDVSLHALRLIPLTDRDSSVMRVSAQPSLLSDPVTATLQAFARLLRVPLVSTETAVVPEDSFAETLAGHADDLGADTLLVPWTERGDGSLSEPASGAPGEAKLALEVRLRSESYDGFARQVLDASKRFNVALFLSNGFGGSLVEGEQHMRRRQGRSWSTVSTRLHMPVRGASRDRDSPHRVFVPYGGTRDDAVALALAFALVKHPRVTLTVCHIKTAATASVGGYDDVAGAGGNGSWVDNIVGVNGSSGSFGKKNGAAGASATITTTEHLAMADVSPSHVRKAWAALARDAQARVTLTTETLAAAGARVEGTVGLARAAVGVALPGNGGDLCIVGRNAIGEADDAVLGRVAEGLVRDGVAASLLVVQSKAEQREEEEEGEGQRSGGGGGGGGGGGNSN